MGDSQEFLDNAGGGESHPAIKWKDAVIGENSAKVVGTIMDEPKSVMRDSLKDGKPEKQLPINLDTADGPRTLWVGEVGFLVSAIKDAVREAGANGLAAGGKLGVELTERRDTGKPFPANVFTAKYQPPAAPETNLDEIF